MTNDKTREAFEKEHATCNLMLDAEYEYRDFLTQMRWLGWQAAIAHQKAESEVLIRQLRDFVANRHNMGKQVRAARRLEILSAADEYLGEK